MPSSEPVSARHPPHDSMGLPPLDSYSLGHLCLAPSEMWRCAVSCPAHLRVGKWAVCLPCPQSPPPHRCSPSPAPSVKMSLSWAAALEARERCVLPPTTSPDSLKTWASVCSIPGLALRSIGRVHFLSPDPTTPLRPPILKVHLDSASPEVAPSSKPQTQVFSFLSATSDEPLQLWLAHPALPALTCTPRISPLPYAHPSLSSPVPSLHNWQYSLNPQA